MPFIISAGGLHFLSFSLLNNEQNEELFGCDFSTAKESKSSFLPRHSHSRNNNTRIWSVPKFKDSL